jgi:hypothetical protein
MSIDSFASKADLKRGPGNVEHDEAVRRGGSIDTLGTRADLASTPSSNMFSSNGRQVESFASTADISPKPIKGWQSSGGAPMSDRATKQSK